MDAADFLKSPQRKRKDSATFKTQINLSQTLGHDLSIEFWAVPNLTRGCARMHFRWRHTIFEACHCWTLSSFRRSRVCLIKVAHGLKSSPRSSPEDINFQKTPTERPGGSEIFLELHLQPFICWRLHLLAEDQILCPRPFDVCWNLRRLNFMPHSQRTGLESATA